MCDQYTVCIWRNVEISNGTQPLFDGEAVYDTLSHVLGLYINYVNREYRYEYVLLSKHSGLVRHF
jgi:hypothetical protein